MAENSTKIKLMKLYEILRTEADGRLWWERTLGPDPAPGAEI